MGSNAEWVASLSIRVQKTRQLFFGKTKYLPKAAEIGCNRSTSGGEGIVEVEEWLF